MTVSKKIVKKTNKPKPTKAKGKERLIIKNFGPIVNFEMEVRKVNVLIGPSSTGKSIVAKLLSIFKEQDFLQSPVLENFNLLLEHYNIPFDLNEDTWIHFSFDQYFFEISKKGVDHNWIFTGNLFSLFELEDAVISPTPDINLITNFALSIMSNESMLFDLSNKLKSTPENKKWQDKVQTLIQEKQPLFASRQKSFNIDHFYKWLEDTITFFHELKGDLKLKKNIYIPAERVLLSMVGETIYALVNGKIRLAPCLLDFAQNFIDSRKDISSLTIPELSAKYSYNKNTGDELILEDSKKIKLENASSGFQSLVPLKVVLNSLVIKKTDSFVVIEEPEINLYPTAQKQLVEEIISFTNSGDHQVCITTHSPYIISSIDNLLKASYVNQLKPEAKAKIDKIIPQSQWIDPKDISCYYLEAGKGKSLIDKKMMMIDHNKLDDVSELIAKTHDKLLNIQYS